MTEFALETPPPSAPGILTGALAERLGYGTQTIRNWTRAGMPVAGHNELGWPLYEEAACRAWMEANVSSVFGRREGAGRKRRAVGSRQSPIEQEAERKAAEIAGRRELKRTVLEGGGTAADLLALAEVPEEDGGLSLKEADRLKRASEVALNRQKLQERAGELVEAGDVRETWTRFLTAHRRDLEALANRGAQAVLAALELGPERQTLIRRALDAEVGTLIAKMGAGETLKTEAA